MPTQTDYWTIAFKGVNTLPVLNAKGEATFEALDTSDPMTDSSWVKVKVAGLEPLKKFLSQTEEATGGYKLHRGKQVWTYRIVCAPFKFPDDMQFLNNKLMAEFSKRYLFLYRGDYDFPDADPDVAFHIHSDSHAVWVALSGVPAGDWERSCKNAEFEAFNCVPVPRAE